MRSIPILIAISFVFAGASPAQTDLGCRPPWFCPGVDGGTTISYTLPGQETVTLEVVDDWSRQRIRLLVDGVTQSAGYHEVFWDGRDDQGVTLETRPVEVLLSGDDWQVEDSCVVNCGNDLAPPVHERAGDKDVIISFWMSLPDVPDAVLDIYEADGVTLVENVFSGHVRQMLGIFWPPKDSPGAPLPAGDYICRLTSSAYSEDVPFYMDPVTPVGAAVVVSDGYGRLVTGEVDWMEDKAQVYGPLQEAWINFDRSLSEPELEYLLGGGLDFDGVFVSAPPTALLVSPDSTSIHIPAFAPTRDWSETLGEGRVSNYGFFVERSHAFQLGYHQSGVTMVAADCEPVGPPDPDDWQVTETFRFDPPCPNPVGPGSPTRLSFGMWEDQEIWIRIYDGDGYRVRNLVSGLLNGGSHEFFWDLADDDGVAVPDGLYHLVWNGRDPVTDEFLILTSGEILVSSLSSAGETPTAALAGPELLQNHPNPFNPSTNIGFSLATPGRARVTVHALDGSLVATLLDGRLPAGEQKVVWNGRDARGAAVPSGAYFYRLETAGRMLSREMMLLK